MGRNRMFRKHRKVIAGRHKCLGKVNRTALDQLLRTLDAFGSQEFLQNRALPPAHHGTDPRELREVGPCWLWEPEHAVFGARKHLQAVAKDNALLKSIQKIVELRLCDDEIEVAAG